MANNFYLKLKYRYLVSTSNPLPSSPSSSKYHLSYLSFISFYFSFLISEMISRDPWMHYANNPNIANIIVIYSSLVGTTNRISIFKYFFFVVHDVITINYS